MKIVERYTDSPFRYAVTERGTTWCYNPIDGIFINLTVDKIISWEKVPEQVKQALGVK